MGEVLQHILIYWNFMKVLSDPKQVATGNKTTPTAFYFLNAAVFGQLFCLF